MVPQAAALQAPAPANALVFGASSDPKVNILLVKFFFRNYKVIPAGIERVSRPPDYTLDAARQNDGMGRGRSALVRTGRVREGRVDDGEQVIAVRNVPCHAGMLRRGIANNGFRLGHLHWFVKEADERKDPRGQQDPMYVVVAGFYRGSDTSAPSREQVEALRALANMPWHNCYVWYNDNGLSTVNFVGRAPDKKPQRTLVVRNGSLVVEDISDILPEERE